MKKIIIYILLIFPIFCYGAIIPNGYFIVKNVLINGALLHTPNIGYDDLTILGSSVLFDEGKINIDIDHIHVSCDNPKYIFKKENVIQFIRNNVMGGEGDVDYLIKLPIDADTTIVKCNDGNLLPDLGNSKVQNDNGLWLMDIGDSKYAMNWYDSSILIITPAKTVKPSFSCRNNFNKTEKLICSNPELSLLDSKLSDVYKKHSQDSLFHAKQVKWIEERNKCLSVECIKNSYRKRIKSIVSEL